MNVQKNSTFTQRGSRSVGITVTFPHIAALTFPDAHTAYRLAAAIQTCGDRIARIEADYASEQEAGTL